MTGVKDINKAHAIDVLWNIWGYAFGHHCFWRCKIDILMLEYCEVGVAIWEWWAGNLAMADNVTKTMLKLMALYKAFEKWVVQ